MWYKHLILSASLFCVLPSLTYAATLSLSPSAQEVAKGETFTVNVILDTEENAIHGVDITYLRYDPSVLEVEEVLPGTLMPLTVSNAVTPGQIQFSQVANGGTTFTGEGILLAINFRTIAEGTGDITFDFTPGNTTDTNVAGDDTDLLTKVTSEQYTISAQKPLLKSSTLYLLFGSVIILFLAALYYLKARAY